MNIKIIVLSLVLIKCIFAVSGTIESNSGKAISNAKIFLKNQDSNLLYIAQSDTEGRFSFYTSVNAHFDKNSTTFYSADFQNTKLFIIDKNKFNTEAIRDISFPYTIGIYQVNGRLIKEFLITNRTDRTIAITNMGAISKGIYISKVTPNSLSSSSPKKQRAAAIENEAITEGIYDVYITGKGIKPYLEKNIEIHKTSTFTFQVESTALWETRRVILRSHYNNARKRFESGIGRVAFLGGSITNMTGWRNSIMTYLQSTYPNTTFHFIEAGIAGKGSTYHAFRYKRDVSNKGKVDLLFIESAVNDRKLDNKTRIRTHEGILRQARIDNPEIDIVQLHFLYPEYYDQYDQYEIIPAFQAYDSAGYLYSSSMQNLARYVAERYTWKEFGSDVHPDSFGQTLYSDNIVAMFNEAWSQPLPASYQMQPYVLSNNPIDSFSYYNGCFLSIDSAYNIEGFNSVEKWNAQKGSMHPEFRNKKALVGTLGSRLTCKFKGTLIGIEGITSKYMGRITYSIDSGQYSGIIDTKSAFDQHSGRAFIFEEELSNSDHTLDIEVDNATEEEVVILSFIVNDQEHLQ